MTNKRLSKNIALALTLSSMASTLTFANSDNTKVVYGEDNRIETYEASTKLQKLANATAGMIKTIKTIDLGDKIMLPPYSIKHDMKLCDGERFEEQPSAVICSGFLVGPDLLVTAGHCITNQKDCDEVSWVFDYKVKKDTGKTDILIPSQNVYKCSKVIEAKLYSDPTQKIDYSLVKLDRVVYNKTPLEYRTSGKVATNTDITVIGHPSGLPQKVSGGAKVLLNFDKNYFQTNLDTFGGNSGSAVFNDKTGEVEGILVRGAKDYDTNKGCRSVHKTTEEIKDYSKYGESVSRITDIKTLKYRFKFLAAVKTGNIDEVKKIAVQVADKSITDNNMNNALHIAAKTNNTDMINALVELGVNIDAQNMQGETPLHIAALSKSKEAVSTLLENNANALIYNYELKTAKDSVPMLNFGIKKIITKAEIEQKKKKKNI